MGPPDQGQQLAAAVQAARDAYRDTTRLIRLLEVLGQPLPPEELLEQALTVLSEVFFAEVTLVVHRAGERLVVIGACGMQESDQSYRVGWPAVGEAAEALATARAVARGGGLAPETVPPSMAGLRFQSGAWVPLTPAGAAGGTDDLLILFRRADDPFTSSDRQVLGSVAARLRLAVEERQRSAVIEQLARFGHRLARHLERGPLLDEAVGLLRQLTEADRTWVVTVTGELAELRAHRGLAGEDLAGWPRPLGEVDRSRPEIRPCPVAATGAAAASPGAGGTLLQVPVVRDGVLVAVLFAARTGPRPFARDAPDTAAIFANYLAVAMVNAELYRTLRTRATHDPLTGLANRTLVVQQLEALLRAPDPGVRPARVGLLFCDLDRFKVVNDLLGHEAGDELLQQVASRLRASVRPRDLLARFGGDEFVVILDRARDLAEVEQLGRRLAAELDHELLVRGERIRVSASIGGVLGTAGDSSASAMLRDADAAMYVAKERGLGQVEVFDEAASGRALDRLDLRSELARALDRDQLRVLYQPVVDLVTGRVEAFEALLRWHHPRHGSVAPEVFVPLAEDSGTMVRIGRWVLEQACAQLAEWQRHPAGRRLAVSVNLASGQLRYERLVPEVLGIVERAGVRPEDLWLEVTEHTYLHHDVAATAAALRAAGVHFALDDFGTAYASLSYLRRFPVEILKIDQSFVSGVPERDTDERIVRAILAIAESLGLGTIADGIETEAELAGLRGLGCRLGQGNLLAPPLSPADSIRLLDAAVAPAAAAAGRA